MLHVVLAGNLRQVKVTAGRITNYCDNLRLPRHPIHLVHPGCHHCFLVDGTDVPIMEPKNTTWRQKAKFYSHKLSGPALRYLIGTHVETGEIVWASSAYPAGTYEPKILEIEVADLLIPGEKALADRLFANASRLPYYKNL